MDATRKARFTRIAGVIAAAVALLALIMLGLWMSDSSRRIERAVREPEVSMSFRTPGRSVDPAQVWITKSEADLRELQRSRQDLEQAMTEVQKELERLRIEQKQKEVGRSAPPVLQPAAGQEGVASTAPAANAPRELPPPPPPPSRLSAPVASEIDRLGQSAAPGRPPNAQDGILVVTVDAAGAKTAASGKEPSAPRRTTRDFLPAGSFVGVTLLSGIDAPTGGLAQTNPHPVLLRLEDDGTLPNRFRSRVRECLVTAAGYGDLPSERAYLRLEKLSCVAHDGAVFEKSLKGFVVGEDGKTGMRGRLVEKRGQYLAKTLLAGTLGGIGSGLSQSVASISTSALGAVQTVDSDKILEYGIGQGVGNALEKLADWYLKRADELYPVIEIDAGRYGEIVLQEGMGLDIDLWEDPA